MFARMVEFWCTSRRLTFRVVLMVVCSVDLADETSAKLLLVELLLVKVLVVVLLVGLLVNLLVVFGFANTGVGLAKITKSLSSTFFVRR